MMSNLDRFRTSARIFGTQSPGKSIASGWETLKQKQKQAADPSLLPARYAEIARVLSLPIESPMTPEEIEEYSYQNIQARPFNEGFRFFPPQAAGIKTYENRGGGFFPIGVGWGKTAVSLVSASKAWSKGLEKMLLLVPSQVMPQLVLYDMKWARYHFSINYPVLYLGGLDSMSRRSLCRSGKKGLYVMPYSYLSVADTTEMLEHIAPELIICDEAHNLSKLTSARTRRLMNFVSQTQPEGIIMSGTITRKSIKDYFHLARWSCGEDNFLPNSPVMTEDWSCVLDADATAGSISSVAPAGHSTISPLLDWARTNFRKESFDYTIPSFRQAFMYRMRTSPRVVSLGDEEIGNSLVIENTPVHDYKKNPDWPVLASLIDDVNNSWTTPSGDEIEHAIHTWKWLHELSAGCYNELTWPDGDVLATRRKISVAEAEDLLFRAKHHHELGQAYASCLRRWLEGECFDGTDTPFLVGSFFHRHKNASAEIIKRGGSMPELFQKWTKYHEADFPDRPARDSRGVRVCDFKVRAACIQAEYHAKKKQGFILWYHHQEVGRWLVDILKELGLRDRVLHCPAGTAANQSFIDHANADKIVVASISAHKEGKNLQHFQHQQFVQWPRPASIAEQVLGRTHRNGQMADELFVKTMNTTAFDHESFAACLNDALYIHQTTGGRQKMVYASYNPIPQIFPSEVLRARGLDVSILSSEQEKMLQEKFRIDEESA